MAILANFTTNYGITFELLVAQKKSSLFWNPLTEGVQMNTEIKIRSTIFFKEKSDKNLKPVINHPVGLISF